MHPLLRTGFKAFLLSLVCALCCVRGGSAQTFDLERDRVEMAEINGMWRFHTGDDARWADPAFDDSSWSLLKSNKPWDEQGYKGYSGLAWYRFCVQVPAQHQPLAILVPSLLTNYQIFANGRPLGTFGRMPPNEQAYRGPGAMYAIPDADIDASGRSCLALRVWHWAGWAKYYGGGPYQPVRIGTLRQVTEWHQMRLLKIFQAESGDGVQLLVALLAAVAALGFYSFNKDTREYLWFGLYELVIATAKGAFFYGKLHVLPLNPWDLLSSALDATQGIFFLIFLVSYLHQRRGAYFWVAVVAQGVRVFWYLFPVHIGNGLDATSVLIYLAAVIFFLIREAQENHDAFLLLPPVLLSYACMIFETTVSAIETAGRVGFAAKFKTFYSLSTWPVAFGLSDLANVLMQLAILFLLVLRFTRTRRDEQRLLSELEAARLVQHVLIPEELPAIPGYQIESVYKPAGEVGGDFFQIIPLKSGSALVAIGDVSGKGVPAAMTVSLLVGTLRTLSYFSQSPALILAAMNDSVVGRSTGGFTTCLVSRIDPNGTVTMANAGHLAPYLGQREIAVDNGLPLGLVAGSKYVETSFQLGDAQQLTFLTDGVVEARAKGGELFGFERTTAVVGRAAREIAEAASDFGQDDDITVVTLKRLVGSADGKTRTITFPLVAAS